MHNVHPDKCKLPEGRYIVVGDLQEGYDVLAKLAKRPEKKLFIGDYLDSFNYTRRQQFEGFLAVLDMIERDEAIAIFGNHEMSYLGSRDMQCSGFSGTMKTKVMPYASRARQLLAPFLYHERTRTLFTHAGLTNAFWIDHGFAFDDLEEMLYKWSRDGQSPFYYIGAGRGGRAEYGGPIWCDWDTEFDGVPGLTQVVGHTGLHNADAYLREGDTMMGLIRFRGSNINTDCFRVRAHTVIFDTADGSFTGLDLDAD